MGSLKTAYSVYVTKNYNAFNVLKANRDISNVQNIIDSIEKVGYIPCPILVNGDMEIIDGQNRFEALKRLNKPIEFYIVDGIGIEEARSMNLGQKNWQPADFIKSYAESGNENYSRLIDLKEKFSKFTYQEIIGIIKGVILNHGMMSEIKDGTLVISKNDYEKATVIMTHINDCIKSINKMPGSKRMIKTGVAWCLSVDGVDTKRIIRVINSHYPEIRPVCIPIAFIEDIENIYNKGLEKTKRIYFTTIWKMEH